MALCCAADVEDSDEVSSDDAHETVARSVSIGRQKKCPQGHPLQLLPSDASTQCSECLRTGHENMWSCTDCNYDECRICMKEHVEALEAIDYPRVMRAQLIVLAHMHFLLPLSPVAFISCYIDQKFLLFYVRKRMRYTTLKMILFAAFLGTVPWLYGNTLMPYPCKKTDYSEVEELRNGTMSLWDVRLQRTGCGVEDWMRSVAALQAVYEVTAFNMFMTFALVLLMYVQPQFGQVVVPFAKHFLPRVLYNGCAACGSDHSAWRRFQKLNLEHHYSYLHDFFGTTDIVLYCLSSVVSTSIYLLRVGWKKGGLAGMTVGAVIAVPLSRYLLKAMNYLFGASTELIDMINEVFRKQQPYEYVMTKEEIYHDKIKGEVERACTKGAKDAASKQEGERLKAAISSKGERVLLFIARWMQRTLQQSRFKPTSLQDLFNSHTSTLVCHEFSLASFACLDLAHFLVLYFDDSEDMFMNWRKERTLTSVCISRPVRRLCTYEKQQWKLETTQDLRNEVQPTVQPTEV